MKIVQDEPAQRQVVLTVELEPSDMEPYLHRAYQRLVQRVAVPGFRKGKTPRSVLERIVGREALVDEALGFLVPEITERAITEQELELSAQPQVEVLGLEPVTLKATVPLIPEVDLGDYTALRVDPPSVTIQEDEVEKALMELRQGAAPWEPADRPVQMGDLLVMDLLGSADGEPIVKQIDASYIVNPDPQPVPGFGEAVTGMQQGETRTFLLSFPDEHPDPKLAGKPCEFTVTAKEIKEQRLPDLDDEFSKSVGHGFDTVEALQSDIRKRLRESQEREAQRIHEIDVVQRVVQDAKVELPPLLIEREIDHLLENMKDDARRSGNSQADVDQYIANLNKSPEEVRESLYSQALERLNREATLAQIARQEDVQAPDQAVQEEIDQMVQDAGEQGAEIRRLFAQPRTRESLTRAILSRRTVQRIAAIARGEADTVDSRSPEAETPDAETQDLSTAAVVPSGERAPAQSEGGSSDESA